MKDFLYLMLAICITIITFWHIQFEQRKYCEIDKWGIYEQKLLTYKCKE